MVGNPVHMQNQKARERERGKERGWERERERERGTGKYTTSIDGILSCFLFPSFARHHL